MVDYPSEGFHGMRFFLVDKFFPGWIGGGNNDGLFEEWVRLQFTEAVVLFFSQLNTMLHNMEYKLTSVATLLYNS